MSDVPGKRVVIRRTHPNLYRSIITFAIITIALGLNFLLIKPAFNQYSLSQVMAVVFFGSGVALIVLLNFLRSLRTLRWVMAFTVTSLCLYGGALTVYAYQTGKTSYQLPICYFGFTALLFLLLIEPASNPLNRKRRSG